MHAHPLRQTTEEEEEEEEKLILLLQLTVPCTSDKQTFPSNMSVSIDDNMHSKECLPTCS